LDSRNERELLTELAAFKIGSENKVDTRQCLEQVQERFGRPLPPWRTYHLQRRNARLLLRQLDKYWNALFGHALVTHNGGLLLVARTNNQMDAGRL